ncbi:MAG TPA: DinB family protein [Polyangiaceae bacterium]
MTPELCQKLARYNRWMNEKLYALAAKLGDDERKRDRGAFFKSIHGTLNHLLVADRIWLGRFTQAQLQEGALGPGGIRALDQELYESFEELERQRRQTDAELESWIAGLSAEQLLADLRYVRKGVVFEEPLWWLVAHLFNHQTHHRGQVTTLLMQAGHDPGVTDLIAMLRSELNPHG